MNHDLSSRIADPRELHVVVGAGPIGSGVAAALTAQDRRVLSSWLPMLAMRPPWRG
jgi:hypothetical protein